MKPTFSQDNQNSQSLFKNRFKTLKANGGGWTPIWRGLVIDKESKHKKAMGSSIWVFLYLLFNAKHDTGIVRRTVRNIAMQTGYSNRSVHRHLKRLADKNYIDILESTPLLTIRIHKWKTFSVRDN